MFRTLQEYLERRKRRFQYSFFECTAGKLREYPRTLELVRSVKDQGATHYEYYPRERFIEFYKISWTARQRCEIQRPFTNKPVKTPWRDVDQLAFEETPRLEEKIRFLENVIANEEEPLASSAAQELEQLTSPAETPVPPTARPIEELFESEAISERADW